MGVSLSDSFHNYQAYGLTLTSNLPLEPWLPLSDEPASLIVEGCQVIQDLAILNVPPLFTSRRTDRTSLYRQGETLYLKIPELGDFSIARDKIQVQSQPGSDLTTICAILLSTVFSLWLEQWKTRAIHASCLVYRGKAAAFMADSTTGKSTLAAALLQEGAELLSDDIVPITETPNGFLAGPSYPSMRLSAEQAQHFLGKQARLARWFPTFEKVLIPIGEDGWGSYCNTPQKIQCMYILNRVSNNPHAEVQFLPLSKPGSVLSLIRFSFLTHGTFVLGIAAERMGFFARLVEQVHVTRLMYPSGYEHLRGVTRRIFQDMDESGRK